MYLNCVDNNCYCSIVAVTCPANMVYQQCGSIYPQSCDSVGRPRISGCAQGCFCPVGLVVDDNGRCVEPTTCPG